MEYFISVDAGNSSIKTLLGGDKSLRFENVVADSSRVDYSKDADLLGAGIQKLDVTVTRQHDKKENEPNRFLLGKITNKYKGLAESRTDKLKSNDTQLLDSILTSIAYTVLYFEKKSDKNIKKMTTININLSTGLPFHEWIIREKRENFKKALTGNHIIQFNHPYFREMGFPEKVELVIRYARICVEGEATANLLMSNEDNEFNKLTPQEKLNSVVVTIDIGGRTTEIIGKQFQEIVENEEEIFGEGELVVAPVTLTTLTEGYNRGIGHVMEATISNIKQQYGHKVDKIIIQDIEQALSKKNAINGKEGFIPSTNINVLEPFTLHAKDYADFVASKIEEIYNKNEVKTKIKRIYITGGGSQITAVVEQLKKSLQADDYDSSLVVPITEPNPVFSNCIGYYIEMHNDINVAEEEGEIAV